MPDEAKKPDGASIGVVVPSDLPLPAPEGANFFHFTVVNQEVQFLVGSINLLKLNEARGKAGETLIVPEITHRFTLSPMGFTQLKVQVDAIAKAVRLDQSVKSTPAS
jgi:hypothetical protein